MNPQILKNRISIVIPVFMSSGTLEELCQRISESISEEVSEYEVVLVDDGSPDDSWKIIEGIVARSSESLVKGIRLSRNFGQHNAILAGLDAAKYEFIIVMDADLQDRPEDIPRLLEEISKSDELQIVVASRVQRGDRFLKKLSSRFYWSVFSYLSGIDPVHNIGTFGIYKRNVIDSIRKMPESNFNIGLLALWGGFKRGSLEINRDFRSVGKSSYNLATLVRMALRNTVSFSNRLLSLILSLAVFISLGSFTLGSVVLVNNIFSPSDANGWASLISVIFFSTGLVMASIGVSGLYVGQILEETRNRPKYLISSVCSR
jgi:glycosyltransferase involved in cell wall biosynthesis